MPTTTPLTDKTVDLETKLLRVSLGIPHWYIAPKPMIRFEYDLFATIYINIVYKKSKSSERG